MPTKVKETVIANWKSNLILITEELFTLVVALFSITELSQVLKMLKNVCVIIWMLLDVASKKMDQDNWLVVIIV